MEDTDYIPSDNESDNSDTSEDKFTAADEKTNLNENSQVGPKRSRWNTPRPSVWKRHVEKSKRIEGKPYKVPLVECKLLKFRRRLIALNVDSSAKITFLRRTVSCFAKLMRCCHFKDKKILYY
uniref:Uncharacterized protein LOC114336895 n=1 Tax=Diabrotica virgifera virgifera TaxID=50390 RepID=A0A6P7GGQ8_DIAVI